MSLLSYANLNDTRLRQFPGLVHLFVTPSHVMFVTKSDQTVTILKGCHYCGPTEPVLSLSILGYCGSMVVHGGRGLAV